MQGSIKKIIEKNNQKYALLDYIQSTGTQYINTNVKPSSTRVFETEMAFNDITLGQECGLIIPTNQRFHFGIRTSKNSFYAGMGNLYYDGSEFTLDTNRHTFTMDAIEKKFYIDKGTAQEKSYSFSGATIPSSINFFLLARNDNGTVAQQCKAKLYSHKVWENNSLTQHLIPVERITDNVLGMLDLVSGNFLTNAGSGVFTKGNYIQVEHIYKPNLKAKTYEKLEYIEFSGTQKIDTGFKPNQDTKIDIDYDATTGANGSAIYFGGDNTFSANSFGMYRNANGQRIFSNYNSDTNITSIIPVTTFAGRHNVVHDKNKLYFDGELKYTHSTQTFQCSQNLFIGAIDFNTSFPYKGKIIKAKIYDNDELELDLIPVKRLKDNAIGMLDTLTNTFYGNSGTGVFTGQSLSTPEYIEEEVEQVDYIENTSTSYIDIDYPTLNYQDWKIEGRINITRKDNNNYPALFGCAKTDWNRSSYGFGVEKNSNHISVRHGTFGTIISNKATSLINAWHDFEYVAKLSGQTLKFYNDDGTLDFEGSSSFTGANISGSSPYLFQPRNELNSDRFYMQCKLSYFKAYSGETLIRDFIPVKYGTEYCLLDLVSNTLFHNAGTGTFTGGNLTEVQKITQCLIHNNVKYYPLDYLENTAQSYINLNIGCNLIKNIELEFMISAFSSDQVLYGSYSNTYKGSNYLQLKQQKTVIYNNGDSVVLSRLPSTSKKCKITTPITSTGMAYFYENDVQVGSANIPNTNRETLPMMLFTLNLNGSASSSHYTKMKVYSFKGWDLDDELLFNLIPVEKEDGAKGMLDLISGTFFGNSGSGTFSGNKREIILVE